jgi:Alginate export
MVKHTRAISYTLPLLLCAKVAAAEDNSAKSFTEMFTRGNASVDFRYRYEHVDDDGFDRSASANTLRSRLTLESASWHGFKALAEGDNVWDFESDNYNSTENGNTTRPTIADPTGTDLNQLYITWSGENLGATGGRQRILHGNQRFIGGVAWRQNEQTYDAVRGTLKLLDGLNIDASYVNNVNRIFGPDDGTQPADWEGDNYLLRADYQITQNHKVAAFGYWLDIDEDGPFPAGKTVDNSTDTYGLEYAGKVGWLSMAAAWATQSEAGDSELDYDADYYMAELGARVAMFNVKAGYEVLGSDNGTGFKTPLATLHKFQGWADKFLSTPGDGIEDLYGSVETKLGPVKLVAVYHDFQAEDSSEDFGTELDLVATYPFNEHLTLQAKYANFDSDSDTFGDTEKFWLTAQFRY